MLSPLTAKTHVARLFTKLARDRAQLVVNAYETGLVRPGGRLQRPAIGHKEGRRRADTGPMRSRLRSSFPLAGLVLGLAALASPAGASVTEYTGLTAGRPAGITAGPDGAVWFTERGVGSAVARMSLTGSLTEHVAGSVTGFTAGAQPADVAAGPDGALWFTEQGNGGAIGRLDLETGVVTEYAAGLAPGSEPTAITAGPDGNLWFTQAARPGIGRITPAGVITQYSAGTSGGRPNDIVTGADLQLWFTLSGPDGVGRLDPATGAVTVFTQGITPEGAPNGIAAASNRKLFFTQTAGARLGRIKTDGRVEEISAGITAGAQPAAIAEGGDGALWFTDASEPGRLGRLYPDAGEVEQFTATLGDGVAAGDGPGGIVAGPDGNVWFTQPGSPSRIVRVTVPPRVEADTPELAADGRVRLKGSVRPNSQATTYFFEYGPTTAYGAGTAVASAGEDAGPIGVSADVELARDAHYHVRVTAVNASGTVVSSDHMFYFSPDGLILKEKPPKQERVEGTSTVDPDALAPYVPGTDAATEPALMPPSTPQLGETITVAPVTGRVRVKPPGAPRYLPLVAGATIRVGSLVDTRRGKVELRSARSATRTQKGRFWGSIFQVRQERGTRGLTRLKLRGGRFGRCPAAKASGALARTAGATRDSGRRRVVRRLWGKDRHARFRTEGRDSTASVRGTLWSTTDRCDGTVTRVKQGKVLVRDLHRKRSVLLGAGDSYLARHRR